jgi:hypothetical protein
MREDWMTALVLITVFAVIGIGAAWYTKTQDGPVEEVAEELMEDQIEGALNLPHGAIDIDLTPSSKEDMKASS